MAMDEKIMVDTEMFYKLQELIAVRKVNNHTAGQLKKMRADLRPKLDNWEEEIGNKTFQVVPMGELVPGHIIDVNMKRSKRRSLNADKLLELGVDPELINAAYVDTETVSIEASVFDLSSVDVMSNVGVD